MTVDCAIGAGVVAEAASETAAATATEVDATAVIAATASATAAASEVATGSSGNLARLESAASEDRRSLRSRKMIAEAFAALITERGLGNFTVSDLMDRADLNRSTFYGHYSDIDDLLAQFKQEIISEITCIKPKLQTVQLSELVAFERNGHPPDVAVELFDTLRGHGSLLRVLLGPDGDAQFQAQLRDVVCSDLIRSILKDKYTKEPSELVEYYISYYSAAMLGLIQRWLAGGMSEDSQTIARILLSVMLLKPGDPIRLKGRA